MPDEESLILVESGKNLYKGLTDTGTNNPDSILSVWREICRILLTVNVPTILGILALFWAATC